MEYGRVFQLLLGCGSAQFAKQNSEGVLWTNSYIYIYIYMYDKNTSPLHQGFIFLRKDQPLLLGVFSLRGTHVQILLFEVKNASHFRLVYSPAGNPSSVC